MTSRLLKLFCCLLLQLLYGSCLYPTSYEHLKLQIYANYELNRGKPSPIMLTIIELPNGTEFLTRITSSNNNYLVYKYWTLNNDQHKVWTHSSDLAATLKTHNIKTDHELPYTAGFYAVCQGTFWDFGSFELQAEHLIPVPSPPGDFSGVTIKVHIAQPSGCLPKLDNAYCSNPLQPQDNAVSHYHMFKANLTDCGLSLSTLFKWSAWDIIETKFLADLGETKSPIIYTKRYRLKFKQNTISPYDKYSIMLRLEVQVGDFQLVSRCYLNMVRGDVHAFIAGGPYRYVNHYNKIIIDGSLSMDLSTDPEKSTSTLRFTWNCLTSSCDLWNAYCKPNMSKSRRIVVPAYTFKEKCAYRYQLSVNSDEDEKKISNAVQSIMVVKFGTVQIYIKCLYNCISGLYHPCDKVKLKAVCVDCPDNRNQWSWYIDDSKVSEVSDMYLYVNTQYDIASVKLAVVSSDRRSNVGQMQLRKNFGPTMGKCYAYPLEGIEFTTLFELRCLDFKSNYNPLHYIIVAAKVAQVIFYTGRYFLQLPAGNSVKVVVCDAYQACVEHNVAIKVSIRHIPMDGHNALKDFLYSNDVNTPNMFYSGKRLPAHILLNSAATRITTAYEATTILKLYEDFPCVTVTELGKVSNLTKTIIFRLNPINQEKAEVISRGIRAMNAIFQIVNDNKQLELLKNVAFRHIAARCVRVYHMFKTIIKHMVNPPKYIYDMVMQHARITEEHVKKALIEIGKLPDKEVKLNAIIWLNCTFQLNRLFHFVYFARELDLEHDDEGGSIISLGVALENQCVYPNKTLIIKTFDGINKVTFTEELLEELANKLRTEVVCLRVISIVRSLNWWYPEERQPSERLLQVHAYTQTNSFDVEIEISNPLEYLILIGKYKPANKDESKEPENIFSRNCNETESSQSIEPSSNGEAAANRVVDDTSSDRVSTEGRFENMLVSATMISHFDAKVYRVTIDSDSLLAVRFLNTTHDLRVLLQTETQPCRETIRLGTCIMLANETDRTMILRNRCPNIVKGYIGVSAYSRWKLNAEEAKRPFEDGPVEFFFVFQLRSCDYWMYSDKNDPHWVAAGCLPGLDLDIAGGVRCICQMLSTYTAYVFLAHAIFVPLASKEPELNVTFLILFLLLFPLAVGVLLLVWRFGDRISSVTCAMSDDSEEDVKKSQHTFIVRIKTGGRKFSGTTANAYIRFTTSDDKKICLSIIQNPMSPQLSTNSTHTLMLHSGILRLPVKMAIYHDGDGRYPTWYLRSVTVHDVNTKQTQKFAIHCWIETNQIITSLGRILDENVPDKWCKRFKDSIERNVTNWFSIQPLTGSWRWQIGYRKFSRFERVCIWINKFAVSTCICAVYFGRTTKDNFESIRESLRRVVFVPTGDLFFLCFICYFASCLVQCLCEFVLVKFVDS